MNDELNEPLDDRREKPMTDNQKGSLSLKPKVGIKEKLKNLVSTKKGKVLVAFLFILAVAGVLYAVPATRYGILGTIVKKDVKLVVVDSQTKKPVSEAVVELAGKSAKTKNDGVVNFADIPVGEYTVSIKKKYYKDSKAVYTLPVFEKPIEQSIDLQATGRQVNVYVVNKISKLPLTKAVIKVSDTSSLTDEKGAATIVLPPNKPELEGVVTLDGYNEHKVTVKVTEEKNINKFEITPKGTLFYLSKITGKINVMQSNLDGSEAKVVVAGTGKEIDRETVLLAARDWQYMALLSRRDGSEGAQLYIVDAKSGGLRTADSKGLNIELIGWWGHRFIYASSKNLNTDGSVQEKTLYSYDADTGKIVTLDSTTNAERGATTYTDRDTLNSFYIIDGNVVYVRDWYLNYGTPSDKKTLIKQVGVDGSGIKTLKELPQNQYGYLQAKLYGPQEIYFRIQLVTSDSAEYYEYANRALKKISYDDNDFNNAYYATYLLSPSDKKTFWHEPRDGKNTLLIGDSDGNNAMAVDTLSDYSSYGWFTDDYVLVSKNGSELYIASSKESFSKNAPLKISNYHKPQQTFIGYGSGYGGL